MSSRIHQTTDVYGLQVHHLALTSTLLCVVKLWWVREGAVELASDVALEYAADLAGGLALGGAPRDIAAGAWAAAHAGQSNGVHGPVQSSVAAAVEPVPGPLTAAGCSRTGRCEAGQHRDTRADFRGYPPRSGVYVG